MPLFEAVEATKTKQLLGPLLASAQDIHYGENISTISVIFLHQFKIPEFLSLGNQLEKSAELFYNFYSSY